MTTSFAGQPVNIGKFTNIAAQTTGTAVNTGPGVLYSIVLNKPIATSVLTLYDGTSTGGTKIGTVTIPASPQPSTLLYNVAYTTGLFVVVGTADMDLTISYK